MSNIERAMHDLTVIEAEELEQLYHNNDDFDFWEFIDECTIENGIILLPMGESKYATV